MTAHSRTWLGYLGGGITFLAIPAVVSAFDGMYGLAFLLSLIAANYIGIHTFLNWDDARYTWRIQHGELKSWEVRRNGILVSLVSDAAYARQRQAVLRQNRQLLWPMLNMRPVAITLFVLWGGITLSDFSPFTPTFGLLLASMGGGLACGVLLAVGWRFSFWYAYGPTAIYLLCQQYKFPTNGEIRLNPNTDTHKELSHE